MLNVLVLLLLSLQIGQVLSCLGFSQSTDNPFGVKNIRLTIPSSRAATSYVRCISSQSVYCTLGYCPNGYRQEPSSTFLNNSTCSGYTAYFLCRDTISVTYSCASDVTGCDGTRKRYTSTIFTKLSDCQLAIPTKFVRCLNQTGRYCYVGSPISESCEATQMLQPPAQTPFGNILDCLNFMGEIGCYRKSDNTYYCQTEATGCGQDDLQVTNSMVHSECSSYMAGAYARCVLPNSAVKCRIAEKVTFANSNSASTATTVLTPLNSACNSGETLMPFVVFVSLSVCEGYRAYQHCYQYAVGLPTSCIPDNHCTGPGKVAVTALSAMANCGGDFHPSSYVRCVTAFTAICRPMEALCDVAAGEVGVTISPTSSTLRLFSTVDSCMIYPEVPQRWVRCKPDIGVVYCSYEACNSGDTRLQITGTTTDYADEAACKAQLYWATLCYTPTATPPYYKLAPGHDYEGAECYRPKTRIADFISAASMDQLLVAFDKFYQTASIPHYRCKLVVGSSTAVPICRPDMDPSTQVIDCYHPNSPGTTETLIASSATTSWRSFSDCSAERYYGKSCYTPTLVSQGSSGDLYTIATVLDTDDVTHCAPTDVDLTMYLKPPWLTAPSDVQIKQMALAFYTPTLGREHRRCRLESNTPVCRPVFPAGATSGDGCPTLTGEARLTSTPYTAWATLQDCQASLFWARACYVPNQNAPNYYTFLPLYDTGAITICAEMKPIPGIQIGELYYTGSTTENVMNHAIRAYSLEQPIIHIRCNYNGVPVCRPNYGTNPPFSFEPKCPPSESLLLGGHPPVWNTLKDCLAQLYWAVPCYRAYSNGLQPYYKVIPGYDTAYPTPGQCADGDVKLSDAFIGEASPEKIEAALDFYYTMAPVPHYRCKDSSTSATQVPVCRPNFSGTNGSPTNKCPSGELELQYGFGPYNDLKTCNAARYWSVLCYDAKSSTPTTYTCNDDVIGCGRLPEVKAFGGFSDLQTANDACKFDKSPIWSRCEQSSRTSFVCRISTSLGPYGCLTNSPANEIRLSPSTLDLSITQCLNYQAYISCYDTTSNTNLVRPSTPFVCKRDYDWCTGNFIQMPSGTSNIFPDSEKCSKYEPAAWIRCERVVADGAFNVGLVVCRPFEVVTCPQGEVNVGAIEGSVELCLSANSRTAWCRCKVPTGALICQQYVSRLSPCCTGFLQIPNVGTFFNSKENCENGIFTF